MHGIGDFLETVIPGIIVIFCLGVAVGYVIGLLLAGTAMLVWLVPLIVVAIGVGVFSTYIIHFIVNRN